MFITKGQAACLVLGDAVTEANRAKCKTIVERTPFEVVYTLERGNTRPIAIGKAVAQRDPFSYLGYPDTPPPQNDFSDDIETKNVNQSAESDDCAVSTIESSKLSVFLRNVITYFLTIPSFLQVPAHANQRTIIMTSKQQKQASWTFCTAF
ncbi:hypothetical protein BX666DRAFT_1912300 [Dichotomocladium elegans]|nr:hypothetical protein BX666DRAFT_1912300 [Dichotomocladium elegans]